MADQSTTLLDVLRQMPITDDMRQAAWDSFHKNQDQAAFKASLKAIPEMPDSAKWEIYFLKFPQLREKAGFVSAYESKPTVGNPPQSQTAAPPPTSNIPGMEKLGPLPGVKLPNVGMQEATPYQTASQVLASTEPPDLKAMRNKTSATALNTAVAGPLGAMLPTGSPEQLLSGTERIISGEGEGGRTRAASDIIRGGLGTTAPAVVGPLIANPVGTIVTAGYSMLAQNEVEEGLLKMGASPEVAALAGDIAGAITGGASAKKLMGKGKAKASSTGTPKSSAAKSAPTEPPPAATPATTAQAEIPQTEFQAYTQWRNSQFQRGPNGWQDKAGNTYTDEFMREAYLDAKANGAAAPQVGAASTAEPPTAKPKPAAKPTQKAAEPPRQPLDIKSMADDQVEATVTEIAKNPSKYTIEEGRAAIERYAEILKARAAGKVVSEPQPGSGLGRPATAEPVTKPPEASVTPEAATSEAPAPPPLPETGGLKPLESSAGKDVINSIVSEYPEVQPPAVKPTPASAPVATLPDPATLSKPQVEAALQNIVQNPETTTPQQVVQYVERLKALKLEESAKAAVAEPQLSTQLPVAQSGQQLPTGQQSVPVTGTEGIKALEPSVGKDVINEIVSSEPKIAPQATSAPQNVTPAPEVKPAQPKPAPAKAATAKPAPAKPKPVEVAQQPKPITPPVKAAPVSEPPKPVAVKPTAPEAPAAPAKSGSGLVATKSDPDGMFSKGDTYELVGHEGGKYSFREPGSRSIISVPDVYKKELQGIFGKDFDAPRAPTTTAEPPKATPKPAAKAESAPAPKPTEAAPTQTKAATPRLGVIRPTGGRVTVSFDSPESFQAYSKNPAYKAKIQEAIKKLPADSEYTAPPVNEATQTIPEPPKPPSRARKVKVTSVETENGKIERIDDDVAKFSEAANSLLHGRGKRYYFSTAKRSGAAEVLGESGKLKIQYDDAEGGTAIIEIKDKTPAEIERAIQRGLDNLGTRKAPSSLSS